MAEANKLASKSEFAQICNVSPGRVTQWITEGKIGADALVGEGRTAKILVGKAQAQLRSRLDGNQAAGNGLSTKLRAPSPTTSAAAPLPPRGDLGGDSLVDAATLVDDALDEQIKRERLDALQRANRKGAEDEAAAQGRYVEAASARRQLVSVAAQTLRIFEGALPEIASALAAHLRVEERDVLLILNEEVRKVRDKAAKASKRLAEGLPALVEEEGAPAA